MKFLLRLVVVILIMESAYAQSNLPACRGSNPSRWSNCFGTYTSPSDQKYVGEFKDGKYNGQGTYTLPSGQRYVGEFKDDNYHGQGTLTFPSGQKYVGEFKNDQRNGQGTLTFPNGNKYVGQWKDDSLNGQGTLFNANGSIINQGIWSDDYFVRSAPVQQATTPDRDNKRLNAEKSNVGKASTKAECESYKISKMAAHTAVAEWTFVCGDMIKNNNYSDLRVSTEYANGRCMMNVRVSGTINGNSKTCQARVEVRTDTIEGNMIMDTKPCIKKENGCFDMMN